MYRIKVRATPREVRSIFPAAADKPGPSAWCTRRLGRFGGKSDEAVADPGAAFGTDEAAGEGVA